MHYVTYSTLVQCTMYVCTAFWYFLCILHLNFKFSCIEFHRKVLLTNLIFRMSIFSFSGSQNSNQCGKYQSLPSFDIDSSSADAKVESKSNGWKWIVIAACSALMIFLLSYGWYSHANIPIGTS
jgi:magnesium-transporting ATPase (P-type)